MNDIPVRPLCPGCGLEPAFVLDGGHQAFCGNDVTCTIIMWDMYDETPVDQAKEIDLKWLT